MMQISLKAPVIQDRSLSVVCPRGWECQIPSPGKIDPWWKIECEEPNCNNTYIGETSRPLKVRYKEHCRPSANGYSSAIFHHLQHNQGHSFKLESTDVLDRETRWTKYRTRYRTCQRCCPGYEGTDCTDVDECLANGGRGQCDQICTNEPGSYRCSCRVGYQLDVDGVSCIDVNECSTGLHDCDQRCFNTYGGFSCGCNDGFYLNDDGRTCSDNDDCFPGACDNGGTCVDGNHTFSCVCVPGFKGERCQTAPCSEDYDPPLNGGKACSVTDDTTGAMFCTVYCRDDKEFAIEPAQAYTCRADGVWFADGLPMESQDKPWPDCTNSGQASPALVRHNVAWVPTKKNLGRKKYRDWDESKEQKEGRGNRGCTTHLHGASSMELAPWREEQNVWLPQNVPHSPAGRTALSRRTYRTLPEDVPHSPEGSPAQRPALSRRTSLEN
ncbi:hypothetical protein Bbelb_065730 [Branchiostoma belcheri]|nr:hypothetical protein Bbelb_065730 [Branchiostoma belcheri]